MDLSPFERYRPLIDDWDAFADTLSRPLPTTIWTHTLRTTPERLADVLTRDGIATEPIDWYPGAFRLAERIRPGKSLAYLSGWYHVQEEVSLIPVVLLDPQPGERLLDLCAAPGNKTAQAAIHMGNRGTVVANERARHRIGVLRRNLERLGITCAAITVADATNLPRDVGLYDRVLADVPCSCEGTSRKNPKVLRRLRRHRKPRTGGQLAILRKAVQRTRPGGRIVYSTCTYAPEENEGVIDALLRESPADSLRLLPARIDGLRSSPGLTRWQGERWNDQLELAMRVWPHHNDTGGFFVAVIEKIDPGKAVAPKERIPLQQPAPDLSGALHAVEAARCFAILENRFGINASHFEEDLVFRANADTLSIVRRDLRIPLAPSPQAVGMPFFKIDMRHPRPTSGAVLQLGTLARRNVLELGAPASASTADCRVKDFVRGREVTLPSRDVERLDGPGWVIVQSCGCVIGIGRCWKQEGRTVLQGMVPKAWAAEVLDEPKGSSSSLKR